MRMSQITFSKPYTIQDTSLDSYFPQDLLSKKEIKGLFHYSAMTTSNAGDSKWLDFLQKIQWYVICLCRHWQLFFFLLRKYHEVALQFFLKIFNSFFYTNLCCFSKLRDCVFFAMKKIKRAK